MYFDKVLSEGVQKGDKEHGQLADGGPLAKKTQKENRLYRIVPQAAKRRAHRALQKGHKLEQKQHATGRT